MIFNIFVIFVISNVFPDKTVFPIRLMKLLGVKQIIITNVAGAINPQYEVGSHLLPTIVTLL